MRGKVLFLAPLYIWGNQGTERLCKLPEGLRQKVEELGSNPCSAVSEATFLSTKMSGPCLEGFRGHLAKVGKGSKAQQIKVKRH